MPESIIVIDDDPKMREMISSVLKEEGYSVETVKNGKQAVKLCSQVPFDVALIDIELPDMKGTELLAKLKTIQPKMITIIITGHPSIENTIKAVNEKADKYILKPFEISTLIETIKKLVSERTTIYFSMLAEIENAKANTPKIKYQNPEKW